MQRLFQSVGELFTPILKESNFPTTGRLTPEEFVCAGDYLVFKCPTWQWHKPGSKSRSKSQGRSSLTETYSSSNSAYVERDFLPKDKQYLVTRGVPSTRRLDESWLKDQECPDGVHEISLDKSEEGQVRILTDAQSITPASRRSITQDGDLTKTHSNSSSICTPTHHSSLSSSSTVSFVAENEEDIPDLESFVACPDNLIQSEEGAGVTPAQLNVLCHQLSDMNVDQALPRLSSISNPNYNNSNLIVPNRTYDLFITYDKFYQTPRMWVTGYDQDGLPLPSETILEDLSKEHVNKTITIEPFPHNPSISMPTIHPCKHAQVMQSIMERMRERFREQKRKESSTMSAVSTTPRRESAPVIPDNNIRDMSRSPSPQPIRVDQYLIVFLKWMATVLPNINYDFTMSL